MDVERHIEWLDHEGDALAVAATGVDPDTPVGIVPDLSLRDLVRHIGGIHRWAATTIREARKERYNTTLLAVVGAWPDDAAMVDWYCAGLAALVDTLRNAAPDLDCWAFLGGSSPRAFWARRQAHETAIHRADAESCTGPVTPYDPAFAADGVDEMLFGFATRPNDFPAGRAPRLLLRATDVGRSWSAQLGPEHVDAVTGPDVADAPPPDCTVDAPASDLSLLLWNRRDPAALSVTGDAAVLDVWRDSVRVRWSE